MNWLSSQDIIDFEDGMSDLFDTNSCKTTISIIKEPRRQPSNINTGGIFAYGLKANINNYTFTPESQSFPALIYTKNPDDKFGSIENKVTPSEIIYIRVRKDARDYILDGRNNLNIIYQNKKYNILSEERTVAFLSIVFYTFKLQMVK